LGTARNMEFGPGEVVYTDGGHFIGCTFEGTSLVYSGGKHPRFEDCRLNDVGWAFADHALRTVQFLQTINASPGGPEFLGQLFAPGAMIADPESGE
jgi:hypothetical protein